MRPLGPVLVAVAFAVSIGAVGLQRPTGSSPKLPSARTVIDRHLDAIGGRKAVLAHSSLHMVGTIEVLATGLKGTIEAFGAKPNKMLLRSEVGGIGRMSEGFDGRIAWSVDPMMGPTIKQGKELEQARFDADFYLELHDPALYRSMETVEQADFDGRSCYKLRLIRTNGDELFEYYEVRSGLRAGSVQTRESPLGPMNATAAERAYKKFGDLLVATTLSTKTLGVEQVITIASVEHDKVDPGVFELPPEIKALVK